MNLKEEIIAIIKSADYEPMSVSDFQDALGLSSADSFRDLIKILVELEQTGMVTRTKQDRYQKQQQKTNSGLVRGTLSQNKRDLPFYVQMIKKWKTSLFRRQKSTVQWMETSY